MTTAKEWNEAYEEAVQEIVLRNDNAKTSSELGDFWECSQQAATRRVKQMIAAGKAERTSKDLILSNGTVQRNVTAYRLITK